MNSKFIFSLINKIAYLPIPFFFFVSFALFVYCFFVCYKVINKITGFPVFLLHEKIRVRYFLFDPWEIAGK